LLVGRAEPGRALEAPFVVGRAGASSTGAFEDFFFSSLSEFLKISGLKLCFFRFQSVK
jgi:hypothetical protein